MGSARANVLGSQKPRTERSLRGALRYGRAGEEEASGGRNGVRLPDLACFLEGVWERWAAGEAAASPPRPPLAPLAACETRSAGRRHARGEGCQARPGRQLPAQMVPMCWSWPDSLPANSHAWGWGGCHGRIQNWSVSVRVPGGKLHAAPVCAGVAGGGFGAPSPRGLRKDSPLPQGRIPLDQAPPMTTPPTTHGGGEEFWAEFRPHHAPRPLTVEFWTGLCHDHAPISVCGF